MPDLKSILSHSPSVVTRKTGNEYVLVPVTDNIADMDSVYTLNETGAFIWEQIDGKKSVEEIISVMTEEYDIDKDTATTDVLEFISKMNSYLIVNE
jgi:Coenzyme PQQ synthesis protein D (PqqD)